jgi:hypothetical protein
MMEAKNFVVVEHLAMVVLFIYRVWCIYIFLVNLFVYWFLAEI